MSHDGGPVGRRYRHTTPEMQARVVAATEERLKVALEVTTELRRWPAGPAAVPEHHATMAGPVIRLPDPSSVEQLLRRKKHGRQRRAQSSHPCSVMDRFISATGPVK
jgi:hypothetical protein